MATDSCLTVIRCSDSFPEGITPPTKNSANMNKSELVRKLAEYDPHLSRHDLSKRSWMLSFTPFEMGLPGATGLNCVASEHSRCASMRHGWVATRAPRIRFLFRKKSFPPSRLPRRCISVSILYRAGLGTERDRAPLMLTLPNHVGAKGCVASIVAAASPSHDRVSDCQSAARTSFSVQQHLPPGLLQESIPRDVSRAVQHLLRDQADLRSLRRKCCASSSGSSPTTRPSGMLTPRSTMTFDSREERAISTPGSTTASSRRALE